MKVGQLKKLIHGLDDDVSVTIEITTSEEQIVSVDLIDIRDEAVGEIILFGEEKGMA